MAIGTHRAWSVAHNEDIRGESGKNCIEQTTSRMFDTQPSGHISEQVVVLSWCSRLETEPKVPRSQQRRVSSISCVHNASFQQQSLKHRLFVRELVTVIEEGVGLFRLKDSR